MKKHKFWKGIWHIVHKDKYGKILFNEERENALFDEGEKNILDAYLRATNTPTSLYIGLGAGTVLTDETDQLTDITEVSGTGYARVALARNTTDWPTLALDSGDYQAESATKTFTAGGTWTGATYAFLTDAASGTSGNLIAVVSLSTTRTLASGDTLNISFKVKLA